MDGWIASRKGREGRDTYMKGYPCQLDSALYVKFRIIPILIEYEREMSLLKQIHTKMSTFPLGTD